MSTRRTEQPTRGKDELQRPARWGEEFEGMHDDRSDDFEPVSFDANEDPFAVDFVL